MAIRTARLAEVYASQGHLEEAVSIYLELVEACPGDVELRERLSALRGELAALAEVSAVEARVERLRGLRSRIRSRRRAA